MSPLAQGRGGVVLRLHVQPGARHDEVAGLHGDRLKLKVAAPPVEGAANERVIEAVARLFGVRRAAVSLLAGAASRRKDVLIEEISLGDAETCLQRVLDHGVR